MEGSPRHCSHCGAWHQLDRMQAISLMTSPAVIGMAFLCACERVDVVLLPVSFLLEFFPDLLTIDWGLSEDAKRNFLKDLENYGHGQ